MCYCLPLQKHCYLLLVKPDSCSSHQHTHSNVILTLLYPIIPTFSFMISRLKLNWFVTCFGETVVSPNCDSDPVTQRNSCCDVITLWGQRSASQDLNVVFTLVWACCSPTDLYAYRNDPQWQQCSFQINLSPAWINKPECISGRNTKEVNDREDRDWLTHIIILLYLISRILIGKLFIWTSDLRTVMKIIWVVSWAEPYVSLY